MSFYSLPSTIIGNDKHKELRAAFSYYNIANSVDILDLVQDALICARNAGFDVFNALDIMENAQVSESNHWKCCGGAYSAFLEWLVDFFLFFCVQFMKDVKFGIGDGHLQYYLSNWKVAKPLLPSQVGLVLL